MGIARVAISTATYAIDKPYDYFIPDLIGARLQPGMRVLVPFGSGSRKIEGLVLSLCETSKHEKLKTVLEVLDETPVLDEASIRLALWLREQCFCTLYQIIHAMLPSGLWYRIEQTFQLVQGSELLPMQQACISLRDGDEICAIIYARGRGRFTIQDISEKFDANAVQDVVERLCEAGFVSGAIRNLSDKTQRIAYLAVSREEAEDYAAGRAKRSPLQKEIIELLFNLNQVAVRELCYFTGASMSTINTLHKNGIIAFFDREVYRRPKLGNETEREEIVLNDEQYQVYEELKKKLLDPGPLCALLFGVTGSGKTLVYMKLMERILAEGKSALVLVPEIALTPQLMERFYSYFGDRVAILHSALSEGERLDEWKRIRTGAVDVVVGTRSAVFAPLSNLGLIILDEEQEHTYKSGNNPRYHAREVAKFRCVQNNALLLLGSATPSVESMYQARCGKYSLHTLSSRYNTRGLPEVLICDLRSELRAGNTTSLSTPLQHEILKNLERGEQSILFLNRRGASRYLVCEECGYVPECVKCSASLVYHAANGRLMCHHCGYSRVVNETCTVCGGKMRYVGSGTQKVEEELHALYPNVSVLRMDTDTTSAKDAHERILNRFRDEKIPILVGTQMITKGLDFENVTLVGVLDADQSIYVDHYRAAENTFSLITQVVGRAGRGEKRGRAVIQTYSPNHPVIQFAANQDYLNFYASEILLRKTRGLPPFRDIISFIVTGERENDVLHACLWLVAKLDVQKRKYYPELTPVVYGPAPAAIAKINDKYRYRFSLCAENTHRLRELVAGVLRDFTKERKYRGFTVMADINSNDF